MERQERAVPRPAEYARLWVCSSGGISRKVMDGTVGAPYPWMYMQIQRVHTSLSLCYCRVARRRAVLMFREMYLLMVTVDNRGRRTMAGTRMAKISKRIALPQITPLP